MSKKINKLLYYVIFGLAFGFLKGLLGFEGLVLAFITIFTVENLVKGE
jgi:hypothetical protein